MRDKMRYAHLIARLYLEGDYMARLSYAMKIVFRSWTIDSLPYIKDMQVPLDTMSNQVCHIRERLEDWKIDMYIKGYNDLNIAFNGICFAPVRDKKSEKYYKEMDSRSKHIAEWCSQNTAE